MDFKEWQAVELVKKLKEKTDSHLRIDEINQIINYLKEAKLFNNAPEIKVFKDPDKFVIEGLTTILVGDRYIFSSGMNEEDHGYYSEYSKREIEIILDSSESPAVIGKKNSFTRYNVSSSGNAYGNYKDFNVEEGNFHINANIVTLVTIEELHKQIKAPKFDHLICVYIGKKMRETDADIAISYMLKSLNLNQG